jgi:glutamate synthase (NADPH/NADH) small chain
MERVGDFGEIYAPFDAHWARNEAKRCIHCLDPAPCQRACPAGIDISLALWQIEAGDFLAAAQIFRQRSSLPEICGRVCPHERMCQGACVRSASVRGHMGVTIPIGALEVFVTEYERRTVGISIPVRPPTGCKVAVVGAGPAGLSCAEQLVRQGHWVTIYDNQPAPGGLLTYGIPNFILPKETIFTIWQELQQAGVRFIGNTFVGKNFTIDNLLHDGCEAIFAGVGIGVDVGLGIPGKTARSIQSHRIFNSG